MIQNEDIESISINEMQIYLGEHIGVVGKTGSGKTYFTCRGLVPYLREKYKNVPVYIIDSTSDPEMPSHFRDAVFVEGDHRPDLLHNRSGVLVWTPKHSKIPKEYYAFIEELNDSRQPAIVVIDEIASFTKEALAELEVLFKQFRKHGGTVVACTQGIAHVSTDIFKQLTHFFLFHINNDEYDMRQARNYLAMKQEDFVVPGKYQFWHRNTIAGKPAKKFASVYHFFSGGFTTWDE